MQIDFTTIWCAVEKRFTAKCPYGEKSVQQNFPRQIVFTAKSPHSEMFSRGYILAAKFPWGEMFNDNRHNVEKSYGEKSGHVAASVYTITSEKHSSAANTIICQH